MKHATTRRVLLARAVRVGVAGAAGAALGATPSARAASTHDRGKTRAAATTSPTATAAATTSPTATAAATTSATTDSATGTAGPPESESQRLHRMLSVELLLLFSYQHVLSASVLGPGAARALVPMHAHEGAHVRALSARLATFGGSPPAPPASIADANRDLARRHVSNRLGQLRGAPDALRLLLAVERVTVGVYFFALTTLQDPRLIRLVTEIMANDAQHEAVLGEMLYPDDIQTAVPYGLIQGVQ